MGPDPRRGSLAPQLGGIPNNPTWGWTLRGLGQGPIRVKERTGRRLQARGVDLGECSRAPWLWRLAKRIAAIFEPRSSIAMDRNAISTNSVWGCWTPCDAEDHDADFRRGRAFTRDWRPSKLCLACRRGLKYTPSRGYTSRLVLSHSFHPAGTKSVKNHS